ncbi:MAG TPA: ATP-binding protein [Dehalococcoidia bacterium]
MTAGPKRAGATSHERGNRIRVENALRASEEARHQIAELLRQTEKTAAELREANQVKDEFLALVSHELRTPVTTILGNASLLRSRVLPLDDADREQAIEDLYQDSRRLSALISNLLVLARLDASARVECEPVLVSRVVARVVAEFEDLQPGRVSWAGTAAGEPMALGHASYIEEVVRNLVSNALKYSPLRAIVEVETRTDRAFVEVSVRDRGVGIEADEMDKLFIPFYRSPRASRGVRGMGVGLAACRRLMEVQGGSIGATPREGGGSEFTLILPLMEPASSEAATATSATG